MMPRTTATKTFWGKLRIEALSSDSNWKISKMLSFTTITRITENLNSQGRSLHTEVPMFYLSPSSARMGKNPGQDNFWPVKTRDRRLFGLVIIYGILKMPGYRWR